MSKMKTLKVLTILLILTTTSGCATSYVNPLCLPSRPALENITIEEQIEIQPSTLIKIAENDSKLKEWVVTTERITRIHNEQFKATCIE